MLRIITVPNISAIDLNLLLVLHVLLRERSATRAAKRLGVTQSAVSNALARLREVFGDPLLVRHARGLTPTPRAEALGPQLAALVAGASALLEPTPSFDPATSTRTFTLACVDYYGVVVVPPLTELLHARAPHTRLHQVSIDRLARGEGLAGDVDVHVGSPPKVPSGCLVQPLFDESLVCLTPRDGRPIKMGLREYCAARHVRVQVLDQARDPIDVGLAKLGRARDIALTVPHFSLAPWAVLRTGYVATLSARLAARYAEFLPLALRTPPVDMGTRSIRMFWHPRTDQDPGARFFRSLVAEASCGLRPGHRLATPPV
jgi:DNA-binding transcriptional LysR family regulator